jgi:23S rRNA U2552 (ribose-2'-O)-methylase RlmE/FtsJ
MTLINNNDLDVPGWKKSRNFLNKHNQNVIIENGMTNDGNLYNSINYYGIYNKYKNSMDLVTGDGGFDFSINYSHQELYATRLIFTEVLYAFILQKQGGCFILKVFDIFTKSMVDIIYLLSMFYHEVYIYKPKTSRLANSEKYIICKNFKYSSNIINNLFPAFYNLIDTMEKEIIDDNYFIQELLDIKHNIMFLNSLVEINSIYGQQQIENINNTIIFMLSNNKMKEKLDNMKKSNIFKCIKWCKDYNIPYNTYKNKNLFMK